MLIKGRPVALTILDFGLFRVGTARTIGIPGFVVTTDLGEHVLIDTGFPAAYAADSAAAAQRDGLDAFRQVLALTPDNLLAGQLGLCGLGLDDISLLILTHSHIDHAGGLHLFRGRTILLGAAERALPRPLYWGTAQPLVWPEATYITPTDDVEIAKGMTVLQVPGHAPGQLAILLELPQTGRVLLTSDAISRPAELTEGFHGAHDLAQAAISAARLIALSKDAFTIWGHCPDQWATLRKAPHSYT